MFHNRPCGCKGKRSCLECEAKYGAWRATKISPEDKDESYVFCPLCELAFRGWDLDSWKQHPQHTGTGVKLPGVQVLLDFVSTEEEETLLLNLDNVPWDISQSGRYKQNYGPKCNFKKKKVKLDGFEGYPKFTEFIQERFTSLPIMNDFKTVEQCSLDYTPDRGSSIDPHIDDCWIWGERIPTLSLMSDSVLTLNKYCGPNHKYNLPDVATYPAVVDAQGNAKSSEQIGEEYKQVTISSPTSDSEELPAIVRLPMPRRSLLLLYGAARYEYEHSVLREDLPRRRVCITYRELTPPFLEHGELSSVGQPILQIGSQFWDHQQVYKEYIAQKNTEICNQ